MKRAIAGLYGRSSRPELLPAGIYHFQAPAHEPATYRLHLRIDEDGDALLVIDASTVLHLNQTATEYAYLMIKSATAEQAVEHIISRYRHVSASQAQNDYGEFRTTIESLLNTTDVNPTTYLGIEHEEMYLRGKSAPIRLDCAVTYALPSGRGEGSAPTNRVTQELSTDQWKTIIDKAWQAGLFHIVFTGGEPTLREDLPKLISHAERNGQVTGLLTDGHRLTDHAYLNSLLKAGLDHTLVILTPGDDLSWEALASFDYWRTVLAEDLFVAAHLTITDSNVGQKEIVIARLAETGISAISLSANSPSLHEPLTQARDAATSLGLNLIWDLPVPYSAQNPVALDAAQDPHTQYVAGSGRGWLYVEPDGDVLPGQGIDRVLGNILEDPWSSIHAQAMSYLAHSEDN